MAKRFEDGMMKIEKKRQGGKNNNKKWESEW
jgi:hypothetical protein